MKNARLLNLFFTLIGIVLLVFLIWRIGPAAIIENIVKLKWGMIALIALGGINNYIKAWSWYLSVDKQYRSVKFWRLLRARLAGEAISNLTFAGPFLGETSKAVIVRKELAMPAGLASVVIDRAMFQFVGLAVVIAGLITSLFLLPLEQRYAGYTVAVIVLALLGLIFGALLATRKWKVLSPAFEKVAAKTGWSALEKHIDRVRMFEETLLHYYHRHPKDFLSIAAINLSSHLLLITEVFLVLHFLGLPAPWMLALVIESFTKLVNLTSFVLPGNVGAYEGGNVLLFKMLSFPASIGMTVALSRRMRAIFWVGIGLIVLAFINFRSEKVPATPLI